MNLEILFGVERLGTNWAGVSLFLVDWKVIHQLLWRMKDGGAAWVGTDDGWSTTVNKVMACKVTFHLLECHKPGRATVMRTEMFG